MGCRAASQKNGVVICTDLHEQLRLQAESFVCCVLAVFESNDITDCIVDFFCCGVDGALHVHEELSCSWSLSDATAGEGLVLKAKETLTALGFGWEED